MVAGFYSDNANFPLATQKPHRDKEPVDVDRHKPAFGFADGLVKSVYGVSISPRATRVAAPPTFTTVPSELTSTLMVAPRPISSP